MLFRSFFILRVKNSLKLLYLHFSYSSISILLHRIKGFINGTEKRESIKYPAAFDIYGFTRTFNKRLPGFVWYKKRRMFSCIPLLPAWKRSLLSPKPIHLHYTYIYCYILLFRPYYNGYISTPNNFLITGQSGISGNLSFGIL